MPLQYAGIIAEHNAVRNGVGVFDVSHLGKLRVADDGEALQRAVTADVGALEPGRATYALVLDESAGCIDDVFVYRLGANEWLVVPNAGNVAAVAEALVVSGVDPVDEWDRWAILAVQGPASLEVFDRVFDTATVDMRLHSWTGVDVFGAPGFVARTGYTGERGIELYAPAAEATAAFRALLDAGAVPVGLGARDTLRLEMGYALYGHEIDRETNPLEAGLGWAVSWDAPFRGREALVEVKERGPRKRLFGIRCIERGVPRPGYRVLVSGEDAGEVVSGNYSPTLGTGIALAYAPAERVPREGERVSIEGRGRRVQGDIVKPPFVRKK